jgi:hypothetical protein
MYALDNIYYTVYTLPMINPTSEYTTIRIWKTTLRLLRRIAAMREESMVAVLDSLVKQEYERIQALESQEKVSSEEEKS